MRPTLSSLLICEKEVNTDNYILKFYLQIYLKHTLVVKDETTSISKILHLLYIAVLFNKSRLKKSADASTWGIKFGGVFWRCLLAGFPCCNNLASYSSDVSWIFYLLWIRLILSRIQIAWGEFQWSCSTLSLLMHSLVTFCSDPLISIIR